MSKNVRPSRLGAVVAAKRKILGLSQRQLADSVGLNNATISKLEKDPSLEPDIRTIQLLAEALHLDYLYLLSLNETIKYDIESLWKRVSLAINYRERALTRCALCVIFRNNNQLEFLCFFKIPRTEITVSIISLIKHHENQSGCFLLWEKAFQPLQRR